MRVSRNGLPLLGMLAVLCSTSLTLAQQPAPLPGGPTVGAAPVAIPAPANPVGIPTSPPGPVSGTVVAVPTPVVGCCTTGCCQETLRKVCCPTPSVVEVKKVVYCSKCIEYCLPKCSLSCATNHGTHGCSSCGGCDSGCCDKDHYCPPTCCACGHPRTKHVLLKKVETYECPANKCEVTWVAEQPKCCTHACPTQACCTAPCTSPCGVPVTVPPAGMPSVTVAPPTQALPQGPAAPPGPAPAPRGY
jgi:hypothetical protein